MDKLIKKVSEDKSHGSIPFWSWNDKLEEDELRRQIRNMKELGMHGFFMHARGGLETEYMSEDWFDCVKVCIDEAKKQGMEAWAYDENGWPSGFAGGALLENPENHVAGLVCEKSAEFPAEDENILGVYNVTENGAKRVFASCGIKEYVIIRRKKDPSYVDVMNPEITRQFIEKTHEVYKEKLGEDFGKAMPGFFTDEPQYFRWGTPWSDTFLKVFEERYGYDVKDGLPAIFMDYKGAEEFRYDYYLLLNESFINNFIKVVYEWCDENGVKLTGHAVEEWSLFWQLMCCGGVMPFYRYQHIPGIDYLCRDVKNITGAKQLGSVCEQTGKDTRLSEMFACCGWDVSPRELKRIADVQFVGGVNLICEHLYAYSERGQRKRDYPNHYSEHNPWQKYYKDFESHYTRLGSLLSQGRELADTLVIHPLHSAYLYYKRDDVNSIAGLDEEYSKMAERLSYDQIPFHFGDETIMRDMGTVEGNAIRVGKCRYNKVVIPFCYTLDGSTVALLKEYVANGGKIYMWKGIPERVDGRKSDLSFLKSNMTYEELRAASGIRMEKDGAGVPLYMQVRLTEEGRVLFFANPSANEYVNTEITVKDCKGLALLNLATLKKEQLKGRKNSDGSVTVLFDFKDSASCVLLEGETEFLPFNYTKEKAIMKIDGDFEAVTRPENMMLLSEAELSLDGGEYSEERPIVRIRDNLLRDRYKGEVGLRFKFEVEDLPSKLVFVAEPMKYSFVSVNGKEIELSEECGRLDNRFVGADISKYTKIGENVVEVRFDYYQREYVYEVLYGDYTESLRNCLVFDNEIENAYLYGDFGVKAAGGFRDGEKPGTYRAKGPFIITARRNRVDISDIVKDGYPFFAGEITAETTINYKSGDPKRLKLRGRYSVCCVAVNGKELERNIFSDEYELGDYLKEGENKLRITACFSNRNLLGPHNRKNPEMLGVGPNDFSYEKEWNGGECSGFVEDKAFVKFGVL